MVEATEAELTEAKAKEAEDKARESEAEQSRELRAAEQAPQHQECPLARAGGVCVVEECEWCNEGDQRGKLQPNEPGGLRGVAGVGERPASERHMPNFVEFWWSLA